MRLRSTLILAVLFAALGAYLYWVELPRDPDAPSDEPLVALTVDEVDRIELEHPGRRVVVERKDSGWHMLEPVDAAADERTISNLLDAVAEARVSRTLDPGQDLPTFGLDAPSASIALTGGGKPLAEIKLGKNTPVGGSTYVLRDGDERIHLVADTLDTRLDKKASDLRDKRVLVFDEADARALRLRTAAGEIVLSRDESGWRITAPQELRADQAKVGTLLSSLHSMRASDFVDETTDQLQRYGLAQPRSTVVIETTEGEPLELRIGSERDGMLRVQTNLRPTVYAVPSWIGDDIGGRDLERDLLHFRDKTVARFAAEDAAAIEIAEGGRVTTLQQADDGWRASDDTVVDGDAVDELLKTIAALEGFEIATAAAQSLAEYGLDPPQRTILVRDGDGAELAAVSLGTHTGDGAVDEYAALIPGQTTVFHLRPQQHQALTQSIAASEPGPDTDTDPDESALPGAPPET